MEEIVWRTAEWAEEGVSLEAYAAGYELEVTRDGGQFFWAVRATAAVSEWPEVVDCGFTLTQEAAKAAAAACCRRAVERQRASGDCEPTQAPPDVRTIESLLAEVEPSDWSNATAHVSVVYLARARRGEAGGFMAMAAGDWCRALEDGLRAFVGDDGPICGGGITCRCPGHVHAGERFYGEPDKE